MEDGHTAAVPYASIPSLKSIPRKGRVKTLYGKPALKTVQISMNCRHTFSRERKADEPSICVMGPPGLTAAAIKIVTSPG